jgi:hypothetical protein
MKIIRPLLVFILCAGAAFAQPENSGLALAPVFTDHMVLQRNKPLQIYGHARAGEAVQVRMQGRSRDAVADGEGNWKVVFPAQKAGGPYELTVSASRERWWSGTCSSATYGFAPGSRIWIFS